MYRVLGVDPSTKSGLCNLEIYKPKNGNMDMDYDTKLINPKLDSKTPTNHMHRIRAITNSVMAEVFSFEPDLVVVEGYSFANKFTSFTAVEINAILRWQLFENNISYILAPPTMLKKFITGKGNCKKQVMLLEVYKRWGVEAKTDDEIDAYGLAMLGAAYKGFIQDMPKLNMSIFDTNDINIIKSLK